MRSSAHFKSSRRYVHAHCRGRVEQADCKNMLMQAPRGLAGPRGLWKVPNPASLVRGSDSFSHQTFTMSLINQMDWKECSLWNQADKAKISGQISHGACEAARSLQRGIPGTSKSHSAWQQRYWWHLVEKLCNACLRITWRICTWLLRQQSLLQVTWLLSPWGRAWLTIIQCPNENPCQYLLLLAVPRGRVAMDISAHHCYCGEQSSAVPQDQDGNEISPTQPVG